MDARETCHLTFPPCFVTGNDFVTILIFAQDVCKVKAKHATEI